MLDNFRLADDEGLLLGADQLACLVDCSGVSVRSIWRYDAASAQDLPAYFPRKQCLVLHQVRLHLFLQRLRVDMLVTCLMDLAENLVMLIAKPFQIGRQPFRVHAACYSQPAAVPEGLVVDGLEDGHLPFQQYLDVLAIRGNGLDDGPLLVEFRVYELAYDCGEHVNIPLHDGQQFLRHLALGLDL